MRHSEIFRNLKKGHLQTNHIHRDMNKMNPIIQAVLITLVILTTTTTPGFSQTKAAHVDAGDVSWQAPPASYLGSGFSAAFRYKTLVGGQFAPIHGKGVLFGEAEWAPGAIYVGHAHPAPEIYYVISGEAEWTVDGKTFKATAGTTIYTKPNEVHRMVNVGDEILKTVWMWWGDPAVLNQYPEIVEPAEKQPKGANFVD